MSDDGGGSATNENNGGKRGTKANGGELRLDRYFDALAGSRRRCVLYYLNRHGSANVDELARQVTARETGLSEEDLPEEDYESVRRELHHKHLPKLADCGLIEYDLRSGDTRFHDPPLPFAVLLRISEFIEGQ